VGGCDDVFGRAETQATIEVYSPGADRWALLDVRLSLPRTSAGVAAADGRCILIAGGAPSQASAEACRVHLPPTLPPQRADGEVGGGDGEAEELGGDAAARTAGRGRSAGPGKAGAPLLTDMPEARMGCQAAVVPLPCPGAGGRSKRCLVVIGGERCEQSGIGPQPLPRVRQLHSIAAYDLEACSWCETSAMPRMATPRTTMALCLGLGRVGPARLR